MDSFRSHGYRVYIIPLKSCRAIFSPDNAAYVSYDVLEDFLHCQETTPSNRFPIRIHLSQLQSDEGT